MPSTRRHVLASTSLAVVRTSSVPTTETRAEPSSSLSWPMARYDAAGTGHHPTASGPSGPVELAWRHDATNWFEGTTPPISVNGRLYAAGGGLLALDAADGTRAFGVSGPYQSSPARASVSIYGTDTLAVSSTAGLFGLNAGGGIGIPLTGHRIGLERWAGPSSEVGQFRPVETVSPVVADGTVYAAVPNAGRLVALDAESGRIQWQVAPDDEAGTSFKRPAVRDGQVFVTGWYGQVSAYHAETGTREWHRDFEWGQISPPVATAAGVVVQTRSDVRLLDPTDGQPIWDTDLEANVTDSAPAVADGRVFAVDGQSSLSALDLDSGEVVWSTQFEGQGDPVVADGIVYAVRDGFELVGIGAQSGEQVFSFRPAQVPLSAPIVGDGRVYAANRHRVVALERKQ